VRRDGNIAELPIDQLNPGDIVIVKPGAEIPVHETVVKGYSFVGQSRITGESMQAEKWPGPQSSRDEADQTYRSPSLRRLLWSRRGGDILKFP